MNTDARETVKAQAVILKLGVNLRLRYPELF